MRLQDYLVETEQVTARDVADAERRSIIYGGSIDTALLELEVIPPEALDAALAGARGLLASPPELLTQPAQRRPWDMLPSAWIQEHEAVPLAMIEDRLWVALHPEVTDEAIISVQQQLPGAALTVTAECWIRLIADQQDRATTPPRYSALAADYLQAIRRARGHLAEDSLTGEVAAPHETFSDVSGGFAIVDDDALEDSLHSAPLLRDDEKDDRARRPATTEANDDFDIVVVDAGDPTEGTVAATAHPPVTPAELANAEVPAAELANAEVPAAELANAEVPAADLANAEVPAAELANAEVDMSSRATESAPTSESPVESPPAAQPRPFIPVIPGLRRASVEPEESDAPDPEHALGENPPFIPALVQEPAPAPAPAAVLPSLRRSPSHDAAVIPQLQRPTRTTPQIPSLTRTAEPVAASSDPAEASGATVKAPPRPSAPAGSTETAFIPTLQRSPKAELPSPDHAADPDAPAPRARRERSSGYVPSTLVHRQAQSTTIDTLISSAIAAGGRREDHTSRLRDLGEAALIRIAQLFPGPLDLPRGDLKSLPTASAHGPLLRLCIALGSEVSPFILARLDDPDANVRFYVALLFQELRAADAVVPLSRLAFDDDRDVRTIAMRVLETYHGESSYPRAVQALRRELQSPDPTRRLRAIRAMGTIRDIDSLGELIAALDDELETAAAALTALCSISGQHLGMASARWTAWLAANRDRSRIDWMIDSLEHRDPAVRRWAAVELHRVTGNRLAFDPHGDEADRSAAIERWRAWAADR